MVWIKNVGMKPVYICGECGLGYRDAKTALECEEFCSKNKACSSEIMKKAVYHPDE
jgi:hypothetical protein